MHLRLQSPCRCCSLSHLPDSRPHTHEGAPVVCTAPPVCARPSNATGQSVLLASPRRQTQPCLMQTPTMMQLAIGLLQAQIARWIDTAHTAAKTHDKGRRQSWTRHTYPHTHRSRYAPAQPNQTGQACKVCQTVPSSTWIRAERLFARCSAILQAPAGLRVLQLREKEPAICCMSHHTVCKATPARLSHLALLVIMPSGCQCAEGHAWLRAHSTTGHLVVGAQLDQPA